MSPSNVNAPIFIGCAGWSIPAREKKHFPVTGSHLERYATLFNTVEINSSFYRSHKQSTYQRWASSVPDDFRFSVKVPKTVTHIARLESVRDLMDRFLDEVAGLGPKLGCLLVQTPPSLAFHPATARAFFSWLRKRTNVPVACEARHASWFEAGARKIFQKFAIASVIADPVAGGSVGEACTGLAYHRLHGAPRIYYSRYSRRHLRSLAARLIAEKNTRSIAWCIFDNTALGHAMANARQLTADIQEATKALLAK